MTFPCSEKRFAIIDVIWTVRDLRHLFASRLFCPQPSRHFRILGRVRKMRSEKLSCAHHQSHAVSIPFQPQFSTTASMIYLTAMCNTSLLNKHLPVSQRHAIITPLIKKPHLDATEVKNYRPVSNLIFVSKVVERLVSERLVGYLQENNMMPVEQSAYRRNHSTETALLRVISDLLNSMGKQEVTLLGLLDLSAAFNCVDHDILLSRLGVWQSIGYDPPSWTKRSKWHSVVSWGWFLASHKVPCLVHYCSCSKRQSCWTLSRTKVWRRRSVSALEL